ncbi:hypothetical protein DPMN_062193 [Dreissena polymorpha]|uniref:Uncharacterized protein n=1 Tax=Dreissena polymorpha TaxID=45954 RepID=A0A9D4HJZ0_DREPO|nr:hypothetical protein DPMN_062193 [Dreissena polymorpha]
MPGQRAQKLDCPAEIGTSGMYVIGTNLLTKFHEERKINVASRVLTRKNATPPGSHVFHPTSIIFELVQDIIAMNLLTKFHEDRTVNAASRVLTRFYYSHIRKNAPPLGSHFFQANIIIFQLLQDIIETNLLTNFHEDWTIKVAFREKFPAPGGHVFKATKTIFELIQDIIGTNLQTKFHDDQKINVTSRVLTSGHAFLPIETIFELNCHIQKTHVLTKFHEYWTKNVTSRVFPCFHYIHIEKTAPPPGGHVFSPIWTIFELVQEINKTNVLTNFHDDWAKIVTSRVFTRKTAPPTGGHIEHKIFEFGRDFIGAKLLTNFHEDGTRNVASRVFTSNCSQTDGHTTDIDRSEKLT